MSKKLTRKGLALGTAVAFGVVTLAGAPVQADTSGNVTLYPAAGDTFNSILYSGIRLNTDISQSAGDAAYDADTLSGSSWSNGNNWPNVDWSDGNSSTDYSGNDTLKWLITSTDADVNAYDLYNSDNTLEIWASGGEYVYEGPEDGSIIVWNNTDSYVSNNNGDTNEIGIYVDEAYDDDLKLSVRAWLDLDGDDVIDPTEVSGSSDTEKSILYMPENVSATTTLTTSGYFDGSDFISSDILTKGDDYVQAKSKLTNDVNPYFLCEELAGSSDAGIDFFFNGSTLGYDSNCLDINSKNEFVGYYYENGVALGNYSAQLWYESTYYDNTVNNDDWKYIGNKSPAKSILPGKNALLDGIYATAKDSANSIYSSTDDELLVRAKTQTVSVTGQIVKDEATGDDSDLKSSGVPVKAVISLNDDLAYASVVTATSGTISGSTTSLNRNSYDKGESIVVTGKTDANGQFTVDLKNTGAKDGDDLDVEFFAMDTSGDWIDDSNTEEDNYVDVIWQNTAVDSFKVSDDVVSGSTISLTYTAKDQFDQFVSDYDGDALHVKAVANVDGTDSATTMKKEGDLVNGKFSISFSNFVAKGDWAYVNAYLTADGSSVGVSSVSTTVYNNNPTSNIIVDDTYSTEINYADFLVGTTEDSAFADEYADSDLYLVDATADIWGTLEDANGLHQPGEDVTISGSGLLFEDEGVENSSGDEIFKKDSITVTADENGEFGVEVYAHIVNITGQKITITSGGKSVTTLLKTYFPSYCEGDDDSDAVNCLAYNDDVIKSSWKNMKKAPKQNVTYAVTLSVTDKWNNVLNGADISIRGSDAAYINGSSNWVYKTLNDKGQTTVYLRSYAWGSNAYGQTPFAVEYELDSFGQDLNADGDYSDDFEFSPVQFNNDSNDDLGNTYLYKSGFFGVQASVKAGASVGKATVHVYNAKGKRVTAVVGGVTKTVTATTNNQVIKFSGVKSGERKMIAYVAGKKIWVDSVTVK